MSTSTIERIPAATLVEDFSLYPRLQVDDIHVRRIAEALRAGETPPPIIADRRTLRIVDGFHRRRAYLRVYGPQALVPVELRDYQDDREILLDVARLNARHGKRLSHAEEVRVALRAQELGVELALVADCLGVRREYLEGRLQRTVAEGRAERVVPLRPALRHLAGEQLTPEQEAVNQRIGGCRASFYARALCDLLEAGAIDPSDRLLRQRLERLHALLGAYLSRTASA